MSAQAAATYVRIVDAIWEIFNSTREGRQRVLDGLAPYERSVLAKTTGPAVELELARRRKTMSTVLLRIFPVTYFAYIATEGADGVLRFFESLPWRSRRAQPGSCFPPAASTSEVFVAFLDSIDWAARQYHWVREAFAFERAYLFGGAPPPGRQVGGVHVRLAEAAWVAEAAFDTAAMGSALLAQGTHDPWDDALALLKPSHAPCAFVCVPSVSSIRRVRLTGDTLVELRWLWDAGQAIPAGALDHPAFHRMQRARLVELAPQ